MTEILLYALGILIIILGLAVSIGLHEIGHLIPAKLFRVRVPQFMIGFGPTLWSKKKGETEYGVKAIPLGGYISMSGMYPPRAKGRPGTGRISRMVEEARRASADSILTGEDHRSFYRLPMLKKITVMLGGPVMNLLLAFVFYAILISGIGIPQSTTTVAAVNECLVPAGSEITECGPGATPAPAAAAGVLPGDAIVAVNGDDAVTWKTMQQTIAASPGEPVRLTVERAGEHHDLTVTPAPNERIVFDARGNPVTLASGEYATEVVGMVGITPTTALERLSLTAVPGYVWDNVRAVANIIVHLPERMVAVWNAAFGTEERDLDSPISIVGVGRIAGEIVSAEETPVLSRVQTMVGLLGSLNVALFAFNLIPLLPLDGGHIIGALYEGAKRFFAKLFGRRDPGPADTARMVPVTIGVVALLGVMFVILIYADLVKPVSLFG